ncbi:uncharacterized protein LOC126265913 [Aethina tumida]|uniref:uncharacterized protein LOC126265913 n=1 Tax=Aethina tumida TaxID=116153 RepID=UPI0021476450|nr:uncharacterized protein LOC126265913 [Aethina tumida]
MFSPTKGKSRDDLINYVKSRTFTTDEIMQTGEVSQTLNPGKSSDSAANTGELSSREAVDSAQKAIPSTTEAEFIKPKKKNTNLSKIISVKSTEKRKAIELQNRYSSLSESETDNEDMGIARKNSKRLKKAHRRNTTKEERMSQTENDKQNSRKQSQPPPIVLKGNRVTTHKDLVETLNKDIKDYTLKFTRNNILVNISDVEQHRKFIEVLQDSNTEFHTYTSKNEKTHAFVLRGLDSEPDIDEIRSNLLEDHDLKVIKIYKLKSKYRPLYMIITDNKVTLKWFNQCIRHVLNIRVYWERRNNERGIIQCHRCQL